MHVCIHSNERHLPNVVLEVERFGGGSVLVWGDISIDNRTNLILPGNVTANMYIRDIIMNHILLAAYGICPGFINQSTYCSHHQRLLHKTQNSGNELACE